MNVDTFTSFSPEELQQVLNNDIFRAMLNVMPVGIAVLETVRDNDGVITKFSYSYRNEASSLMANGYDVTDSIIYGNELFEALVRVTDSGTSEDFSSEYTNDSDKQIHYSARKVSDSIVLTAIEVTDHKKAEQKIIALNKSLKNKNRELQSLNNELKTFTSIAALDYKETLKTLYTNLEYIISHDASHFSSTGRANLRKAQTAIQKMKLLTDDIVSFSSIQNIDNNLINVDLNSVLKNISTELNDKLSLPEVSIENDNLPIVNGFPYLIDLLFFQILDNALKFRNADGRCEIKISHHITKERNTDNDMHQISFIDKGIGFEQQESDKIFEMFYRINDKKYKGSGIGLTICKKIMTLHGGTIAVESEPDKGTVICCFFPVH